MQVQEAMTPDPITCQTTDVVSTIASLMRKHRIGGIPVVENGKIAGIVTETDVLKLLMTKGPSDDLWLPSPLEVIELPIREFINWEHTRSALTDIGSRKISEVMSSPVITISPEQDVEEAASLMLKKKIDRLAVVQNEELVGVITREDIVWAITKGRDGDR
ncbi:MAG TPA: CBS domain-containing protein [Methanospirillum sp.]|nr:CBS domain-containing protein [Methanospirillum sp.]